MNKKILICLLIVFIGIIEFSEQQKNKMLYEMDFSSSLISEEVKKRCGYRYRIHKQTINYQSKCVDKSDSFEIFRPHIEENIERKPSVRVIGGREAYYREAPWAAQFAIPYFYQYTNGTGQIGKQFGFSGGAFAYFWHGCTGTLISDRHILFGAHCIRATQTPFQVVFMGDNEKFKGPFRMFFSQNVSTFSPEHYWNDSALVWPKYDIAILVLPISLNLSYYDELSPYNKTYLLNPVCLPIPEREVHLRPNQTNDWYNTTYFGFGRMQPNIQSPNVRRANLEVNFDENQRSLLVTHEDAPEKICYGDSGGGLVQFDDEYETRAVIVGVAQSMKNKLHPKPWQCTHQGIGKGFFVNVAIQMDWIYDVIRRYP